MKNVEEYLNNPRFIENFEGIARKFLIRDNDFLLPKANEELRNIRIWLGYEALIKGFGGKFVNEPYVRMRRVGMLKKMNRRDRINVALSLENALNHAIINFDLETLR